MKLVYFADLAAPDVSHGRNDDAAARVGISSDVRVIDVCEYSDENIPLSTFKRKLRNPMVVTICYKVRKPLRIVSYDAEDCDESLDSSHMDYHDGLPVCWKKINYERRKPVSPKW